MRLDANGAEGEDEDGDDEIDLAMIGGFLVKMSAFFGGKSFNIVQQTGFFATHFISCTNGPSLNIHVYELMYCELIRYRK